MAKESSIVRAVRVALEKEAARRGVQIKVEKRHGNEFSVAGEPDLFGSVCGRHFELEIKQPGKKPTELQFLRLQEWAEAGAITGWATSAEQALRIIWGEGTCTQERDSQKSERSKAAPRLRSSR